jgi:hypothetical protein
MTIVCVGTLLASARPSLRSALSFLLLLYTPDGQTARRFPLLAPRTARSNGLLKLMSSRSSSLSAEPEDLPSTNPRAQPGMGAVLSSWKGKDRAVADGTTKTGPFLPDEVIRVANEVRSRPHCVLMRLTFLGTAS